jgi:hypothetical protein
MPVKEDTDLTQRRLLSAARSTPDNQVFIYPASAFGSGYQMVRGAQFRWINPSGSPRSRAAALHRATADRISNPSVRRRRCPP